ncbi:UNVERIFIED_ORG: hypothetical protein M2328_006425 [Rhodococcus erythropolis]
MMPIVKIFICTLIALAVGSVSALVRRQEWLDSKDCLAGLAGGLVAAYSLGVG